MELNWKLKKLEKSYKKVIALSHYKHLILSKLWMLSNKKGNTSIFASQAHVIKNTIHILMIKIKISIPSILLTIGCCNKMKLPQ